MLSSILFSLCVAVALGIFVALVVWLLYTEGAAIVQGGHSTITEVVQLADRVEMRGLAQSSTRVSALMRNVEDSEWLKNPGLDVVETVSGGIDRSSQFKIFAQQVSLVGSLEGEAAEGVPPQ